MNKNNWLSMISLAIIVSTINTSVNAADKLRRSPRSVTAISQSKKEAAEMKALVKSVAAAAWKEEEALSQVKRVKLTKQSAIKAAATAAAKVVNEAAEIAKKEIIEERKKETAKITAAVKESADEDAAFEERKDLRIEELKKQAKSALEDADAELAAAKKSVSSEEEIADLKKKRHRAYVRYNYYRDDHGRAEKLKQQRLNRQENKKRKSPEEGNQSEISG